MKPDMHYTREIVLEQRLKTIQLALNGSYGKGVGVRKDVKIERIERLKRNFEETQAELKALRAAKQCGQ